MATLVINAPYSLTGKPSKQSFDKTLKTKIGKGYALNCSILSKINAVKTVILLDKYAQRKAIGVFNSLRETREVTGNGIRRFNIHMSELKECKYEPVPLNRNGVAILSDG